VLSRADAWERRGRELIRQAKEARRTSDYHLAAILDKDGAALIRMADEERLVEAGTHRWHPLTGRLVPTNHERV
jgi:hypothetical protein